MRLILFLLVCAGCSENSGTLYTSKFDERKFQGIKIGARSNDVISALGQPLRIDLQLYSEKWIYSPGFSIASSGIISEYSIPIDGLVFRFDKEGLVSTNYGSSKSYVGSSHADILSLFGKPVKIETNAHSTVLHYTEGNGVGSFKVRAIVLDEYGKVTAKHGFHHRD